MIFLFPSWDMLIPWRVPLESGGDSKNTILERSKRIQKSILTYYEVSNCPWWLQIFLVHHLMTPEQKVIQFFAVPDMCSLEESW